MSKKRLTLQGGGVLLALSVLFFALCTPISILISNDVIVSETFFPTVWDMFQMLVIFLIFWNAIAFILIISLRFGWRGSLPFLGCYAGAALLRVFGSLLVGTLMTIDATEHEFFWENLAYGGLDFLLELIQITVIFFAVYLLNFRKSTVKTNKNLLPPHTWFRHPTRLHGTVLLTVSIPSAVRLIERIRYDLFFGAPQGIVDLLWMIFYYLTDLFSVFVGYVVVMFLLFKLSSKRNEKEDDPLSIQSDLV